MNTQLRLTRRIRHELKLRLAQVRAVTSPTPRTRRVTLAGEALAGFTSLGFDDHVKLFFPAPGEEKPVLPALTPNGPIFAEGTKPVARDYTPRAYDVAANALTIDFALHGGLHGDGPAAHWAAQAAPGQWLGVGGPRGSFVVTDTFDWYLFAGDETALPAIGRRLAELRPQARAIVVAEVADAAEEQPFESDAALDITWLHRGTAAPGTGDRLEKAVAAVTLPPGDGHAWVAAEAATARGLREVLLTRHRLPKEWVRASAYWKRGASAVHETLEN